MDELMKMDWYQELMERLSQVFAKLSLKFLIKILLPF